MSFPDLHPERAAELAEIQRLRFAVAAMDKAAYRVYRIAVTGEFTMRTVMERFGISAAQAKRDIRKAKKIAGAAA